MSSVGEKNNEVNIGVASRPDSEYSAPRPQQQQQHHQYDLEQRNGLSPSKTTRFLHGWATTAFLVSYFVFSIALYTILDARATKAFWFLYLTIATFVSGLTVREAYDGLTPLREARKAIAKADTDERKWKVAEDGLPFIDLVFDRTGDDMTTAIQTIEQCLADLTYPPEKVHAFILADAHDADDNISTRTPTDKEHTAALTIVPVPSHAASSLSSRVRHFFSQRYSSASFTALFSDTQLPHPHAARLACERLSQDTKVDILQGRSVFVPRSSRTSVPAAVACLEHDLFQAVLHPGQGDFWNLRVPSGTNAYWRTDALRNACPLTADTDRDGHDLGFTSARCGARAAYDLRICAHEPCPGTLSQYWQRHVDLAQQLALATVRYTGLAFQRRKAKQETDAAAVKWPLLKRAGILYMLPISCIVSHVICQYFSMALALLFTKTPRTAFGFAHTIYFTYPISEWLIILG